MKKANSKPDAQPATKAKPKAKFLTTRTLVSCAMLSACSALLILIEFPLPFIAPEFYKLDLSEIPALIGGFSMGPLAGIIIELIKILIHLLIKGTSTAFVGELSNFILGSIFVITASVIYRAKKEKPMAIIGLISGGLLMSLLATVINAFIIIPLYSNLLNIPTEVIVDMGTKIFPIIDDLFDFCIVCVLPFNLIKALLVSVVTVLIYKPLSKLIKGKAH